MLHLLSPLILLSHIPSCQLHLLSTAPVFLCPLPILILLHPPVSTHYHFSTPLQPFTHPTSPTHTSHTTHFSTEHPTSFSHHICTFLFSAFHQLHSQTSSSSLTHFSFHRLVFPPFHASHSLTHSSPFPHSFHTSHITVFLSSLAPHTHPYSHTSSTSHSSTSSSHFHASHSTVHYPLIIITAVIEIQNSFFSQTAIISRRKNFRRDGSMQDSLSNTKELVDSLSKMKTVLSFKRNMFFLRLQVTPSHTSHYSSSTLPLTHLQWYLHLLSHISLLQDPVLRHCSPHFLRFSSPFPRISTISSLSTCPIPHS